jgi:hypothetical protein
MAAKVLPDATQLIATEGLEVQLQQRWERLGRPRPLGLGYGKRWASV